MTSAFNDRNRQHLTYSVMAIAPPVVTIRDIDEPAAMCHVEELQKEVWGWTDRDVVPVAQFVAAKAVGGMLLGAFDEQRLIGFAYGFVGYEAGQVTMHSDMLAVKPAYQNIDVGFRLKLAQREKALANGFTRMTWTFDPLQSRNAHFNFSKLGIVADAYKINFYGEKTSSFLHQLGTDRLWASWLLRSERVVKRIAPVSKTSPPSAQLARIAPLVRLAADNSPEANSLINGSKLEKHVLIEIPADINGLQQRDAQRAAEWRRTTRQAFTEVLAAGYTVEEFYRLTRSDGQQLGVYLLGRSKRIEDCVAGGGEKD